MEEEKKEQEQKHTTDKMINNINKQVEEKINIILEKGIQMENIDVLGKLVDIHKDLSNEKYWKKKEEVMGMRYRDYDEYNEGGYVEGNYGRRRDSRGRYMERGRGRSYRGEEMIEEMMEHYGNYSEGGRYNGPEKEKAFDYMLKSAEEFFTHLMEEAENPEQMEKIKRTARKISEMRM